MFYVEFCEKDFPCQTEIFYVFPTSLKFIIGFYVELRGKFVSFARKWKCCTFSLFTAWKLKAYENAKKRWMSFSILLLYCGKYENPFNFFFFSFIIQVKFLSQPEKLVQFTTDEDDVERKIRSIILYFSFFIFFFFLFFHIFTVKEKRASLIFCFCFRSKKRIAKIKKKLWINHLKIRKRRVEWNL